MLTLIVAIVTRSGARDRSTLGGWSVDLILIALAVMMLARPFAVDVDGIGFGPLADHVTFDHGRVAAEVHGRMFNVLSVPFPPHLLALSVHLAVRKFNPIGPTVRGRRLPNEGNMTEPTGSSSWKVLVRMLAAPPCARAVPTGLRS